jgi:hypothetical protein
MTDVLLARFANADGSVALHSLGKARVLVVLSGKDAGAFGDAPFLELEQRLSLGEPLELFFDLHAAESASLDVSASWGVWLRRNAARLSRVCMLTRAPVIQLSARAVQRFSELGERARLYSDPVAFERELRAAS